LLTVCLKKQSNKIPVVLRARAQTFGRVTSGFRAVASKPPFRRFHYPKEKHMSKSPPTHYAYVVNARKDDPNKKDWRRVGAVWPHGKGGGFDVAIYDQLAVSGRITCTVPKDDEAPEDTAQAE
jgi:hypothetical protein